MKNIEEEKTMLIEEIKAKRIFAGPGNTAFVAEARVKDMQRNEYFVTVQDYDGTEYTVAKESVYAFLAEDNGEPASEFLEEYTKLKDAKTSSFANVFMTLKSVLNKLG